MTAAPTLPTEEEIARLNAKFRSGAINGNQNAIVSHDMLRKLLAAARQASELRATLAAVEKELAAATHMALHSGTPHGVRRLFDELKARAKAAEAALAAKQKALDNTEEVLALRTKERNQQQQFKYAVNERAERAEKELSDARAEIETLRSSLWTALAAEDDPARPPGIGRTFWLKETLRSLIGRGEK